MHFLLINHIQNAQQSLRSSRFRSVLTMLGVSIGVASITMVLALSCGANKVINGQVDSLGGSIAVIRPVNTANSINNIVQPQTNTKYTTSPLTESDLTDISQVPKIKYIAPLMVISGSIKADSTAPSDSTIVATSPHLAKISDLSVNEGQFLDDSLNKNTVVIGKQLSINLFGTDSSVGRTLTIREKTFTVIGILAKTDNPINYNLIDFDNAAIINLSSGKELNQNVAQIQQINIKTDSITYLDQIKNNVNNLLTKKHGGEHDFAILTGDQISQPTSQLFYAVAGITAVIATISLIVGGVSIMNIMLMTVSERTREIGIRKALGANNADISWQFLIESLILSISGGLGGYIFGYIAAFGVSVFLTFEPVFNLQIFGIAMAVSTGIGILFGVYPAIKASHKDPIESLRQYK